MPRNRYRNAITWLEMGIEYNQNNLKRMMHKNLRKAFRENTQEYERAIEILRKEGE